MKMRLLVLILIIFASGVACRAQKSAVVTANFCDDPKLAAPGPGYRPTDVVNQPDQTADLPSVVQTVEQALKCYQAMSQDTDPLQPKGLPKLNSVAMDFKTTTGATVGITFSVFIFKVGASHEKDVTNDLSFTYSVPKQVALAQVKALTKPKPAPLFEQLVNDVRAAARAAQAQSTALNMPLSKVSITIAYGIKFDGNVALNVPINLVTIGGNGDYNKNNTQTITLTFGQSGQ